MSTYHFNYYDSSCTSTCPEYNTNSIQFRYEPSSETTVSYQDMIYYGFNSSYQTTGITESLRPYSSTYSSYCGIQDSTWIREPYIPKKYGKQLSLQSVEQIPKQSVSELSEEDRLRIEEDKRIKRLAAQESELRAKIEAKKAAKKARLLLTECLDSENLQRLFDKKSLEIQSKLFEDIKYSIPLSNGRIKAIKENKVITELCLAINSPVNLPTDDVILAKFLYALHDEENMLRTANHFCKKEDLLARLN